MTLNKKSGPENNTFWRHLRNIKLEQMKNAKTKTYRN